MKQSQFKELIDMLGENLSVLPDTIPVRDIANIEEQILSKKTFLQYDPATHGGSYKLYEHFLEHKDLKWIWCHSGDRYGADPVWSARAECRGTAFGDSIDRGADPDPELWNLRPRLRSGLCA